MIRLTIIRLIAVLIGWLINQVVIPDSAHAAQTISRAGFSGTVARAYQSAKSHPQVFGKLFCYCGCDKEAGHTSLSDCYKDDHGKTCAMCQAEAMTADSMINNGSAVRDIQRAIDSSFAVSYKGAPSQALLRYRREAGQ